MSALAGCSLRMSWGCRGLTKIALTSLERAVGFVLGFGRERAFSAMSLCWHPSIPLYGHSLGAWFALPARC